MGGGGSDLVSEHKATQSSELDLILRKEDRLRRGCKEEVELQTGRERPFIGSTCTVDELCARSRERGGQCSTLLDPPPLVNMIRFDTMTRQQRKVASYTSTHVVCVSSVPVFWRCCCVCRCVWYCPCEIAVPGSDWVVFPKCPWPLTGSFRLEMSWHFRTRRRAHHQQNENASKYTSSSEERALCGKSLLLVHTQAGDFIAAKKSGAETFFAKVSENLQSRPKREISLLQKRLCMSK